MDDLGLSKFGNESFVRASQDSEGLPESPECSVFGRESAKTPRQSRGSHLGLLRRR